MSGKEQADFNRGDVRHTTLMDRVHRGGRPLVMGILNVTPDSFYDGGRHQHIDSAVRRALQMIEDGADIIDIGGESTRPGAEPVPIDEEKARVLPVVDALRSLTDIPISIDTWKPDLATEAIVLGADMINDISFGTYSGNMFRIVAENPCMYVGMHIQGNPRNMQKKPVYKDVVRDVRDYLAERGSEAERMGVLHDRIMIDPGIGFGKTDPHNISLINGIGTLKELGYPVLVGTSRKSMFGRLLGLQPENRLVPSIVSAVLAVNNGARIVRVHDVAETVIALRTSHLLCE